MILTLEVILSLLLRILECFCRVTTKMSLVSNELIPMNHCYWSAVEVASCCAE